MALARCARARWAEEYVDAMRAGPRASLRPIHDRLLELSRKIGKDVRVCPGKRMVPVYRRHVFAWSGVWSRHVPAPRYRMALRKPVELPK